MPAIAGVSGAQGVGAIVISLVTGDKGDVVFAVVFVLVVRVVANGDDMLVVMVVVDGVMAVICGDCIVSFEIKVQGGSAHIGGLISTLM